MSEAVNQSGASGVYNCRWRDLARLAAGWRGLLARSLLARPLWAGPLLAHAWPASCLVCGSDGGPSAQASGGLAGLCPACAPALPWNRHACRHCALPLPASAAGTVCGRCLRRPPPLDACHAAFVYRFPLDRLLPRAKFHDDLAAGRGLGEWMAAAFAPVLACGRPDALVPVPLHRERLRRRGYDQALELARPLAAGLGLPLDDGLLRRVRATGPQSRLDAAGRRRNLRAAFAVDAARACPRHVVLVDDVMTTGATLHAAARALRRAGVARVDAWVCARVP
ncbi:competence protein ComF [Lysobacter maris]|uniref:Competence protein ComF n=1 Tax=Marilutibacter maris TaxID=1605891 RepID=A0A2U9T667_9GAMM|nr:competence protein ComF [Lysobacter maris]